MFENCVTSYSVFVIVCCVLCVHDFWEEIVCMCMYKWPCKVHTHTHARTHTHIRTCFYFMHLCARMYVRTFTDVFIFGEEIMYVRMLLHVFLCMYARMYLQMLLFAERIHVCKHAFTHVCKHAFTHVW
jgi:hypothetical protein